MADTFVYEVIACLEADGSIYVLSIVCEKVEDVVPGVSKWRPTDGHKLLKHGVHFLGVAACWRTLADGIIVVP